MKGISVAKVQIRYAIPTPKVRAVDSVAKNWKYTGTMKPIIAAAYEQASHCADVVTLPYFELSFKNSGQ